MNWPKHPHKLCSYPEEVEPRVVPRDFESQCLSSEYRSRCEDSDPHFQFRAVGRQPGTNRKAW